MKTTNAYLILEGILFFNYKKETKASKIYSFQSMSSFKLIRKGFIA